MPLIEFHFEIMNMYTFLLLNVNVFKQYYAESRYYSPFQPLRLIRDVTEYEF